MSHPNRSPDVLYIGYSKSGSTFVREFLEQHPDVYWDRFAQAYLAQPEKVVCSESEANRRAAARVYVSMAEKLCESLVFKDGGRWGEVRWRPNAWNELAAAVEVGPEHIADAWKARFPDSKVLIVIRNQLDWFDSLYRMYIDCLQPGRRSFVDFCATPMGAVLLRAGMYDVTIEAYLARFGAGNVKVLRYERLRDDRAGFLREMCAFLGVATMPFDAPPANVGRGAGIIRVHRYLPSSRHAPRALKRLAHRLLAGGGGRQVALSKKDARFIEATYAVSNLRTEGLLTRLDRESGTLGTEAPELRCAR